MRSSKLILSKYCLVVFLSLLASNCLGKNENYHRYWSDFYSLQLAIKKLTNNEVYLYALNGILSKETSHELRNDEGGDSYIELGGQKTDKLWNLSWYPSEKENLDYRARVRFKSTAWGNKSIYSVHRETISHWTGYMPRDFFNWLNQFARLSAEEIEFNKHKNTSPSFRFLCETFTCQTSEESLSTLLEFAFSETTESKFPSFYKRTGTRLEKTNFSVVISDLDHPEDHITISNNMKTLQFRFPIKPRKEFFRNPRSIQILSNITIKSFGVKFEIHDLRYRLNYYSQGNKDVLSGHFVDYESKKFTGNFLYFIPTGVIDFFIPGNIDEYLSDALTLLVYGTQGKGGSQFKAAYDRSGIRQKNTFTTYSEILQSRFSLFGADSQTNEYPSLDFFAQWENAILQDFK
jgi:hypothetical protein